MLARSQVACRSALQLYCQLAQALKGELHYFVGARHAFSVTRGSSLCAASIHTRFPAAFVNAKRPRKDCRAALSEGAFSDSEEYEHFQVFLAARKYDNG